MILMTLSEIKEKISFEIVKLKQLILTSKIDYNKFYVIKSTVIKLLKIEELQILVDMKKRVIDFQEYNKQKDEISSILKQIEDYSCTTDGINQLIIRLETHI